MDLKFIIGQEEALMTNIAEEDKKLLETLGLQDIPEDDKQVVLDEIDEKMTRRFIANILVSLSPDRARELEAEIQNIPSENTQEIIEKIIEKHPDAARVLQDSAKQIVEELQKGQNVKEEVADQESGAKNKQAEENNENIVQPSTGPTVEKIEEPIGALEEKPLPVPQEESSNPFGSEIKIVSKDEPETKNTENKEGSALGTESLALKAEQGSPWPISNPTVEPPVSESPASAPIASFNPFSDDKPQPSSQDDTSLVNGQQPIMATSDPAQTPSLATEPATPSNDADTNVSPAPITTDTPDDSQATSNSQPQTGSSDYYQG